MTCRTDQMTLLFAIVRQLRLDLSHRTGGVSYLKKSCYYNTISVKIMDFFA